MQGTTYRCNACPWHGADMTAGRLHEESTHGGYETVYMPFPDDAGRLNAPRLLPSWVVAVHLDGCEETPSQLMSGVSWDQGRIRLSNFLRDARDEARNDGYGRLSDTYNRHLGYVQSLAADVAYVACIEDEWFILAREAA